MDTLNVITLYFAKAFAIYMIVTGLAGLAVPQRWRALVDDLERSAGLTYIAGAFVLILGITLVFLHSFWSDALAIIVSLISILVMIEGILLMIMPDMVLRVAREAVATDSATRLAAGASLAAGVLLFAAAALGRAGIA